MAAKKPTATRKLPKLSPKRQKFVREYLIDLNATQAAIRAGYSARTARMAGSRLLTNDDVKAVIDEALRKRAAKTELTAEWIVEELRKVAGQEDVKVATKVKALELLSRHLGMSLAVEKHDHRIENLTEDEIKQRLAILMSEAKEPK